MSRYLSICCLTLACLLVIPAQVKKDNAKSKNKPDLTGNWLLDRASSNAGPGGKTDLPVKISYRDPELRITHQHDEGGKIVGRDFVYYTDGRGETNPATKLLTTSPKSGSRDLDKQVTKSKTRWSGNKLVTRATLRNLIAGHVLEFEVIEEWKLSSDGKTLTQTSRTVYRSSELPFIPSSAPEHKMVYSRIP